MKQRIEQIFNDSIDLKKKALTANCDRMIEAVEIISKAFEGGHRVFFCGNGGSAADSQHIAAEFVGRFQKERKGLPAIALTTDTSILTALANDYSYDKVFSRQIEALGQKDDILFGISTSGNSKNVIEAVKAAKLIGMQCIVMTGRDGGALSKAADLDLNVPSDITARVQESHLCIAHTICELVEDRFSS